MVLHHISEPEISLFMSGCTGTIREYFGIIRGIILVFCICTCLSVPVMAAPDLPVNATDTVTVVMDNNYPPFSFRDANGNLVGISVDMWRLWEKQTGKKVAITGLGWDDAINRMEAGEFDVIDTVFYSDERAKIYDFTPSYTDVDVVIFFNADVSGISNLDSLNGFVVGMHKGDSTIEDVEKKGVTVREYDSYEDVVTAAKNGEIVVFILDKPSGVYYLYKQGIQDQFRQTPPVIKGALHRAVKKGDTALLAEINSGFAQIPKNEYEALDRTWYGTPVISPDYLRVIAVFAGVVILILVLLVFWNRTLNRTVAQKTAELNAELEQRRRVEQKRSRKKKSSSIISLRIFPTWSLSKMQRISGL
jgi:ABC-type amino acid transport substrate-binding protein